MQCTKPPRARGTSPSVATRQGKDIKLRPAHIVLAAGTLGKLNIPEIPGRDAFSGPVLHSEGYNGDAEFAGKYVVVVGAGNSCSLGLLDHSKASCAAYYTH